MKKVLIYDIETLLEMFLIVIYIPEDRKWIQFEVSKANYGLDKFIKFKDTYAEYYWVGYNNLRFDSQVIEWILRNYDDWEELGCLEITAKIAQKAQDVIHDANYEVFPEYRESELTLKQIDLFRINHFDNKNRMVSLKRLEFEMDMENIEEMPIHHAKIGMTSQDLEDTRYYCKNDVKATYQFYKVTIGDTDHPLYKGNNQIELRENIKTEYGIDCLNYSDSKIGDEMIKKFYCEEKKINPKDIRDRGTFRKYIRIRHCIANYISFKTPQLQNFQKELQRTVIAQDAEFLEELTIFGQTYTFAKGGLHTVNTPKIFEATEDYLIVDWDVSSYYPAIIINNGKFPNHLGKEFLIGYRKMFEERLLLKPKAKHDKRIKGIVGALKLAVNSVYGKSSDMQSWMMDKKLTLFTTITGELSLMMLIEAYELEGIKVISANTDGVTVKIHKDKLDKMNELNAWWMNLTSYELERSDYSKIIFSTVNDYIAIKTDGEIKRKGDFLIDFELHKNKSGRIIPIALNDYFVKGIPINVTINEHSNVFDFAIRQKASKDFHYEGYNKETKKNTVYHKLIRYYIAKKGEKLLKIKNPECTTNAVAVAQVDAGNWVAVVCNNLTKNHSMDNINRQYYIDKATKLAMNINYEGKTFKIEDPNQLKLF